METDSDFDYPEGSHQLIDFIIESYHHMSNEDYQAALTSLSTIQNIIRELAESGAGVDPDLIVTTLHNIAFCYQKQFLFRLGYLTDALQYLQASIHNNKQNSQGSRATIAQITTEKLNKGKYECRSYLQMCAMASQLQEHKKAHDFAKLAMNLASNLAHWSLNACNQHKKRHALIVKNSRMKRNQYSLRDSPHYKNFHEVVKASVPILRFLEKPSLGIPKLQGSLPIWVQELTIREFMMIQPLSLGQIKATYGIENELLYQNLLYIACLISVSCFSLSVEINYLTNVDDVSYNVNEAKYWHRRALLVCKIISSPLADYIRSSFAEFYESLTQNLMEKRAYSSNLLKARSQSKMGMKQDRSIPRNLLKTPNLRSRSQLKSRSRKTK